MDAGHGPASVKIQNFGTNDALTSLRKESPCRQIEYLYRYLRGLEASSVVMEPFYFDRDYLAEFSTFYGVSAARYPNTCERLHFFSGPPFDTAAFRNLLHSRADSPERKAMQDRYLGFSVIRPLPGARLGRTVLKWWSPNGKVVAPSRDYCVHLAGIPLKGGSAGRSGSGAPTLCGSARPRSALAIHPRIARIHRAWPSLETAAERLRTAALYIHASRTSARESVPRPLLEAMGNLHHAIANAPL
jgi:hypothetical protein